jgi:hypothetical protein
VPTSLLQCQLFVLGYRFRNGSCWKRTVVAGKPSMYWECITTIDKFIYSTLWDLHAPESIRSLIFKKSPNDWNLAENLTNVREEGGWSFQSTLHEYVLFRTRATVPWLQKCGIIAELLRDLLSLNYWLPRLVAVAFPTLVEPSRHVFAFPNGIYVSRARPGIVKPEFLPVPREDGSVPLSDMFVPNDEVAVKLVDGVVACRYFDQDFDVEEHARVKALPVLRWADFGMSDEGLRSMLLAQRYPDQVQLMFYTMTGRLLGEIRESDNFEMGLYLIGEGGSGKSTFIESVAGAFFAPGDVCHAGSNGEQVFGLQNFIGKFLVTLDETAKKMGMNQQDFQVGGSMCLVVW